MTKKKIVLIGGTGKVGGKVANLLLAQNHHVTLIARHKEKLLPYEGKGATIVASSVTDVDAVADSLKGADVILTMIASNPVANDFLKDQVEQAESQVEAIKKSGIKNVVNLSSNGCHVTEGNGVIQGLSYMEALLNDLEDVNVIHIRPTFYMENVFYASDLIKHQGIYGLPIKADKTFPMIATKDVADVIADKLTALNFKEKSVLPLLGDKDYSLPEFINEMAKAVKKQHIPYIQFPVPDFIAGIVSTGGTQDFANRFAELMVATDNGLLNYHPRTKENTTPTTAATFATAVFEPAFLNN